MCIRSSGSATQVSLSLLSTLGADTEGVFMGLLVAPGPIMFETASVLESKFLLPSISVGVVETETLRVESDEAASRDSRCSRARSFACLRRCDLNFTANCLSADSSSKVPGSLLG